MVDWSLARQVARLAAGADEPAGQDDDLRALCSEMEAHVASYTGLTLAAPAPQPEVVTRAEWTPSTWRRYRACSTRSPSGSTRGSILPARSPGRSAWAPPRRSRPRRAW